MQLPDSRFRPLSVVGIEIAIENQCHNNFSKTDCDPDTDSDFDIGKI